VGRAILLDEADVAYCAAVYKAKHEFYNGQLTGVNIFDKKGRPYRLRYREIADMRRNQRRQQKRQESRAA
jgi:UDP-N-acetylmuramate-alanine ligase